MLGRDELRRLFALRKVESDTHDSVSCKRCPPKPPPVDPEAAAAAASAGAAGALALTCGLLLPLLACPSLFPALRVRCVPALLLLVFVAACCAG